MFERFTAEARGTVVQAQATARRLGHRYIGCEHLLAGVAAADGVAGETLRASGVTPAAVESAIQRLIGDTSDVDRAALASIGIDLDVVRERIEATFGPGALESRRRRTRRRWLRRRDCEPVPGHIPFTPRAKRCLELSLREAQALHDGVIGAEHLALALTAMDDGMAPEVFAAVGTSPAQVRAELLRRYRRAG
jgi:ATP-dependent Clp protease ATP-binding subunit ClpA